MLEITKLKKKMKKKSCVDKSDFLHLILYVISSALGCYSPEVFLCIPSPKNTTFEICPPFSFSRYTRPIKP